MHQKRGWTWSSAFKYSINAGNSRERQLNRNIFVLSGLCFVLCHWHSCRTHVFGMLDLSTPGLILFSNSPHCKIILFQNALLAVHTSGEFFETFMGL